MIFKKGKENIGICLTNRVTSHVLFCILDCFNLYFKHLYISNFFFLITTKQSIGNMTFLWLLKYTLCFL